MSLSNKKLRGEGIKIKSFDSQSGFKNQFKKYNKEIVVNKIIPYGRQNISDEDISSY